MAIDDDLLRRLAESGDADVAMLYAVGPFDQILAEARELAPEASRMAHDPLAVSDEDGAAAFVAMAQRLAAIAAAVGWMERLKLRRDEAREPGGT